MVAKAHLVVACSAIRWSSFGLTSSGVSAIPTGFALLFRRYPALTRWAILRRRYAALLRLRVRAAAGPYAAGLCELRVRMLRVCASCGSVCCGSVRAAGLCELRVCGSVRLRVYAAAPRLCCCQASRLAYAAMWRLRGVVSCREKSRGRCGRSHGGQWGRTAEGWTVCRLRACTANAIGPGFAILAMRVVGNGSEVSKVSTAAGSRVRRI